MNQYTAIGKLWELDLKTSRNGKLYLTTSISIYQGKDQSGKAQYFNLTVKAFGDAAGDAADDLQKGDNAIIVGTLTQETWDDKATGKKQYKMVLMADHIGKDTRKFAAKRSDPASQFGKDVADEEVPW